MWFLFSLRQSSKDSFLIRLKSITHQFLSWRINSAHHDEMIKPVTRVPVLLALHHVYGAVEFYIKPYLHVTRLLTVLFKFRLSFPIKFLVSDNQKTKREYSSNVADIIREASTKGYWEACCISLSSLSFSYSIFINSTSGFIFITRENDSHYLSLGANMPKSPHIVKCQSGGGLDTPPPRETNSNHIKKLTLSVLLRFFLLKKLRFNHEIKPDACIHRF